MHICLKRKKLCQTSMNILYKQTASFTSQLVGHLKQFLGATIIFMFPVDFRVSSKHVT